MPWVPIAAAVISAAGTAAAANQAKQANKGIMNQQQQAMDAQNKMLAQLQPYGSGWLSQGQNNMNTAQNYWQQLASGNRNQTMQALAPEINAVNQQYQGSVNAQRGLMPRGGATTAATQQLPYQQQGAINNLLFSARPQANQQLAQLGQSQANLGLGAFGQGAGLTNNMLNYGLQSREQQFQQGNAIGSGIGNMGMLWYMMNQGRGTPNAGTNSGINYGNIGLGGNFNTPIGGNPNSVYQYPGSTTPNSPAGGNGGV